MNQNLRFGSEATSSARSSAISQRAPFKAAAVLLGAGAAGLGCAPDETTINHYYQGPDGRYVSLRQEVPSNCTLVASGSLNVGENLNPTINGRRTWYF
jgi:hypothetical protein